MSTSLSGGDIANVLQHEWNHFLHKEIIVKNPMLGVIMPTPEQFDTKEIRYLSEDEISRLKNAATAKGGNGKPIYPLGHAIILMLNTGVRVGEALAWRWSDYDEAGSILHTKATLARVRDRTEGERSRRCGIQHICPRPWRNTEKSGLLRIFRFVLFLNTYT